VGDDSGGIASLRPPRDVALITEHPTRDRLGVLLKLLATTISRKPSKSKSASAGEVSPFAFSAATSAASLEAASHRRVVHVDESTSVSITTSSTPSWLTSPTAVLLMHDAPGDGKFGKFEPSMFK
jgi:hypothetical protein